MESWLVDDVAMDSEARPLTRAEMTRLESESTSLDKAIAKGDFQAVWYLLERQKADPNAYFRVAYFLRDVGLVRDIEHVLRSPLGLCIFYQGPGDRRMAYVKCFKLLLMYGANPTLPCRLPHPEQEEDSWFKEEQHLPLIEMLTESRESFSEAHLWMLKLLLADPRTQPQLEIENEDGQRALESILQMPRYNLLRGSGYELCVAAVELFLAKGADARVGPLLYTAIVRLDNPQVCVLLCTMLLDAGANPNAVVQFISEIRSPLMAAIDYRHTEQSLLLMQLLLNKGADPRGSMHALYVAAKSHRESKKKLRMLLTHGADPLFRPQEGGATLLEHMEHADLLWARDTADNVRRAWEGEPFSASMTPRMHRERETQPSSSRAIKRSRVKSRAASSSSSSSSSNND
jgi:hypothetical protein